MIITITSIKLRTLWSFFTLAHHALQILKQTRQQKGFITMKKTGFGKKHYTLSAWETAEDMKNFSSSGAHLTAMKQSRAISTEIAIYSYSGEALPPWDEAKRLLEEKGKVFKY